MEAPPLLDMSCDGGKGQDMVEGLGDLSAIEAESEAESRDDQEQEEAEGRVPSTTATTTAIAIPPLNREVSASSRSGGEGAEQEAQHLRRLMRALDAGEGIGQEMSSGRGMVVAGAPSNQPCDHGGIKQVMALSEMEETRGRLVLRLQELSLQMTLRMEGEEETGSESVKEPGSEGEMEEDDGMGLAELETELDETARALIRLEALIDKTRQQGKKTGGHM